MSDWQAENAKIEEEHRQLHAMVRTTLSTLANQRNIDDRQAAIALLRSRLLEHFAAEEEVARAHDPDLHQALHDGHNDLTALLDRAKSSLVHGKDAEGKRLLAEFTDALARHDDETDLPLFSLMARGTWANSAHYWDPREE